VAAAGLSQARARLLEHVQGQGEVTVEGVASVFGQHPNTVREHLEALTEGGFLLRERSPGPGRGRPAWRYRANPDQPEPDPRVREYGALAGALAAHIAAHSPDPRAEAREAGARWGSALIRTDRDGSVRPSAADAADAAHGRVVRLLADLDFSPRADRPGRIVLTTCPLLDVARTHPDVVCAVHEGMVAGALDALGAPSSGVTLRPFAAPDGCVLRLPSVAGARSPGTGTQAGSANGLGSTSPVRRVIARTAHETPDRAPLRVSVGDEVHAGNRDNEWPEFVFVTATHGTGWVPARHLSQPSGPARVQMAYDTTELPTSVNDALDVLAEDLPSGWLWCRSSSGQQGWVPMNTVEDIG
jgi:predicted ArsR family transcriptional regulator